MDITVRCRISDSPTTTGMISSAPPVSPVRPPELGSAPRRPQRHPSSDRKKHPP
jgi:hypothetical protein